MNWRTLAGMDEEDEEEEGAPLVPLAAKAVQAAKAAAAGVKKDTAAVASAVEDAAKSAKEKAKDKLFMKVRAAHQCEINRGSNHVKIQVQQI